MYNSADSDSSNDLVAVWNVPLHDGVHRVEFEHGTTSGKRIIRVDGKEILRRDWMFKLVGRELFNVGKAKCAVNIEAYGSFAYQYSLEVNGKAFQKFNEHQSKILQTWTDIINGEPTRICLVDWNLDKSDSKMTAAVNEHYLMSMQKIHWNSDHSAKKDTLDVWVNGRKVNTMGEFVDDGTETHFEIGERVCCIKAFSSGKKRQGMIHKLIIDGREIQPCDPRTT